MDVKYVVHSAVVEQVAVVAMLDGHEVAATMKGLTVELLGEGEHRSHGHTFRFIPKGDDAFAEHVQMFTVGNTISAEFSLIATVG